MKKFTYGDGLAIMILAAERMGLNPKHVDDAKRQAEGGTIHSMTAAAMENEAAQVNDQLRHDEGLIAKANLHAEQIKAEYGFVVDISKEAFLALQTEAEELEMAHAQGQDLPLQSARLAVIDKIMNRGQWTLHPDYGCILKSEVNARDREAMPLSGAQKFLEHTDANAFLLARYDEYVEHVAEGDPMEFDDWLAGSDIPEVVEARNAAQVQALGA